MTDYGTIKLPRDEYERHNERRKDMGLTWSEYVDGEIPVPETPEWGDAAALEIGEATGDFADQLDRIEAAAREATNAAQNAESAIEGLQR